MYSSFDPTTSILAGLDTATLQGYLASAQAAMATLMSGGQVATASYTQGDGSKSITFRQTDMSKLMMWIQLLQMQLGIGGRRRPMRPLFC